ncbi:glycosyltransferase family 9 protein [Mucilaginibacter sp. JRF]|uniref:glycosyltransferase family 9 protein n=1 Tax=Mucilaginibacter sp. JRF TaxID=2780088 RepID=UPI0018807E09|nr:glycosyltransferase family 9 protein [Mucilaginibacter sp. JRF]MBE9583922.1 glycosyltransferase family 9 protein [Mucilaginibacter sp. JRF]
MAQNRNLYRLTRFILLRVPYLFRLISFLRPTRKKLLIIKADAIGDYIIFRNFIEQVKTSTLYRDHEIHLLGNDLWADLAREVDGDRITRFYFTRPNSLYYNPRAVFKLGWQLFTAGYNVVLNPNSTRTFITDGFAGLTAAKQTIGFESDTEGIELKFKRKTDRFYTRLLQLPGNVNFEFYRHRYFFETVLNQRTSVSQPKLELGVDGHRAGIIIMAGAGLANRAWEPHKFTELITLLLEHTTETIYIAGAPGDAAINQKIIAQFNTPQIVNITGQTSLTQLCRKIASATLVIANDSGAIHIAAATGTPSVCVVGGGHFERFVPYPESFVTAPVSVFKKMECYYCNWRCIYTVKADEAFPCIGNIAIADVWQPVKQLL